jgi:hypothetical protein
MGGTELAERFSRRLASRFFFVSGYGPVANYNEDFGPFLPNRSYPVWSRTSLVSLTDLLALVSAARGSNEDAAAGLGQLTA